MYGLKFLQLWESRRFSGLTDLIITTIVKERWSTINVGKREGRRPAKCQTLPGIIREEFPEELAAVLSFGRIKLPVSAISVCREESGADNIYYVNHLTQSNLEVGQLFLSGNNGNGS